MFVPRFKEFSRYTPKPLPPKRQRDWGYSWAGASAVTRQKKTLKHRYLASKHHQRSEQSSRSKTHNDEIGCQARRR